ncbi:hypothetical protein V1512DRAFT_260331 [Lipomyces arxii]|uniref:uncharacterized protein n=1 Tax=Lipomyces arxii TaxID=56418 RepID=UPI0034CF210E
MAANSTAEQVTINSDQENQQKSNWDSPVVTPLLDYSNFDTIDIAFKNSRKRTDEDDSDEFEVSKSEVKKRKRKEKRKSRLFPTFDVDSTKMKEKISVADVRDLVLWILADGIAPKWLSVFNKLGIPHVVTILIPGLTPDLFGVTLDTINPVPITSIADKLPPQFTFWSQHIPLLWPTRAPGDRTKLFSPTTAFLNSPLPKTNKSMKTGMRPDKDGADEANLSLGALLMSAQDFVDADFPIHSATVIPDSDLSKELQPGWVETVPRPADEPLERPGVIIVQSKYRVYGIDCEMCITTHGSALTRATVVNWDREIIMDELVKPEHPITDYLTQYSGITAKLLDGVTTTLGDVQKKLLSMIHTEDIIVGHSLENDFNALQFRHPSVIDTSVIYHHSRGLPAKPSLKWLAQRFMKKDIQQGGHGHDSAEDARTCIDLLKLKIAKGFLFGTCVPSTEPIMKRMQRYMSNSSGGSEGGKRSGTSAVVEYGNPIHWHSSDAKKIVSCNNDDEVVAGVIECACQHDFTWGRLRELEFQLGWNNRVPKPDTLDPEKEAEALSKCLTNLNTRLEQIWKALSPATALILLSGSGDPREMSRLNAMRNQFSEEFKTKKWDEVSVKWTDTENQLLLEAAKTARSGVSFIAIKGIDEE